jgi:hypothetical protein
MLFSFIPATTCALVRSKYEGYPVPFEIQFQAAAGSTNKATTNLVPVLVVDIDDFITA